MKLFLRRVVMSLWIVVMSPFLLCALLMLCYAWAADVEGYVLDVLEVFGVAWPKADPR